MKNSAFIIATLCILYFNFIKLKTMKRIIFLCLIFYFALLAQAQELMIEMDKTVYLIGEPIYATFIIKNNTSVRIWADNLGNQFKGFDWKIEGDSRGDRITVQPQRFTVITDWVGLPPRYPIDIGEKTVHFFNLLDFSTADIFPSKEDSVRMLELHGKSFRRPNFGQYLPAGFYTIKVRFQLTEEDGGLGREITAVSNFEVRAPQSDREKEAYEKLVYAYFFWNSSKVYGERDKAARPLFEEISEKYQDTQYAETADFLLRDKIISKAQKYYNEIKDIDFTLVKKYPNTIFAKKLMSNFQEEDIKAVLKDVQEKKVAEYGKWLLQMRPKWKLQYEIQQKEDEEKMMRWNKIEEKMKQRK